LDFPDVDWVVQADAPEDREMYIHRAGRTARYRKGGSSLLILTPFEEKRGFVQLLQGKNADKIPLKKLSINPTKATVVTQRAASSVASNAMLHQLAKKAFQSYVRCIYLMPHKEIFVANELDLGGFSQSLGLASIPNLRFLKSAAKDRSELRQTKNINKKLQRLKEQIKAEKLAKKLRKMGKSASETEQQPESKLPVEGDESDDDLLVPKKHERTQRDNMSEDLPDAGLYEVSKPRHRKKIQIDGSHIANKHVVFNDDGVEEDLSAMVASRDLANKDTLKNKQELKQQSDQHVEKVRARLQSTLEQDREEQKARVREKHKKRRLQDKDEKTPSTEPTMVTLETAGGVGEEDFGSQSSSSVSSEDDSSSSSSPLHEHDDLKAQEDMALSLIRGTL
jgi:ATP-dependent RNA helicase DDX10/DBP4